MSGSFARALLLTTCLGLTSLAGAAVTPATKAAPGNVDKQPPPNVLSIIPAQGEPGSTVTLSGSGFTERTTVNLGTLQLPGRLIAPQQLAFDIPQLSPGLYALYVRRGDNTTSRTYSFTVLPQKPVADSLSPDSITTCASGREREVQLNGRNFQAKSQLIFDGAAIRSRYLSSETLSFSVPQVAAGLHQVQVRNQDDSISGILGLMIDGRPEVSSVYSKEDYVTTYNLVIEGRNFQQNSTLVVTEESSLDQESAASQVEVKRLRSGQAAAAERDRVVYMSCNQLIYKRFPYSTTLKNFRIQVVNPNGEESTTIQVSAP